jgi:hypothetical protein
MVKYAIVAVIAATGLASCDAARERLASTTQNGCAECKDPEDDTKGYYVSIGVMPSPYPISWKSPNTMYATTLLTSAVGAMNRLVGNPLHGVGHVLLKVQCGDVKPEYISQTGAIESPRDPFAQLRELQTDRVNMLFRTWDDGFLDPNGKRDWETNRVAQKGLNGGTYKTTPREAAEGVATLVGGSLDPKEKDELKKELQKLDPVSRHQFVRATILITKEQCEAIRDWRKAYADSEGPKRYGAHRAPWVLKGGKYDGGACGSVSFAGAFYASGLDYKKAAASLTERQNIGTSRLTKPIERDPDKPEGWYLLQDDKRFVPGRVPCKEKDKQCVASSKKWFDPFYNAWTQAPTGNAVADVEADVEAEFSKSWDTGADVLSAVVPLIVFTTEKFYQEILGRLNDDKYQAFGHGPWCKLTKDGVPVIVLDGTGAEVGRPAGINKGFDTSNSKLF